MNSLRYIKRWILKSHIPPCPKIQFLNALLEYGQWLRRHPPAHHYQTREELYAGVASHYAGKPFDFIEAGVFQGESIRYWSTLSQHAETRFYGFDTFHGLPEAWHTGIASFDAGHFDTGGQCPNISDTRVHFVKGRFQDTLPVFLEKYQPRHPLIIHCDADLYSSTLYLLTRMNPLITPGTVILFDNFSVATHDFRAFRDYTQAYCRAYEVMASAEIDFEKIAIVIQ